MNTFTFKKLIGVGMIVMLAFASMPGFSYAAASARTGNAVNIKPLSATLTAEVVADTEGKTWMNVHNTWFDYGEASAGGIFTYHTRTRGNRTSAGETFIVNETISGLSPDTTYLYRIVVRNELGHMTYGVTRSFRTLPDNRVVYDTGVVNFGDGSSGQSPNAGNTQQSGTVVPSPQGNTGSTGSTNTNQTNNTGNTSQTNTNTNGNNTSSNTIQGPAYVAVAIENEREEMSVGSVVAYKVTVKNISNVDLDQVFIQVDLQRELEIIDTERGAISESGKTIFVEQNDLDSDEVKSFLVTARLIDTPEKGSQVAARATVLYTNPTSGAQDQVLAYDIDDVRKNGQLAATASAASFLPNTFIEWVAALILLTLIIVIGRKLYDDNKKRKEEKKKKEEELNRERELLMA